MCIQYLLKYFQNSVPFLSTHFIPVPVILTFTKYSNMFVLLTFYKYFINFFFFQVLHNDNDTCNYLSLTQLHFYTPCKT